MIFAGIGFCTPQLTDQKSDKSSPDSSSKFSDSPSVKFNESVSPSQNPSPSTTTTSTTSISAVEVQLSNLLIKGRAPTTGYERELFGSPWLDVDRNGCDTRNDILQRDLTNIKFRPGTNSCVVESGYFFDPYTTSEFEFVKSSSASSIEIDHIVSLSDAWQKGAQQWDSQTRKQFANDPLNLVATSQSANRQKSDSDAASWLPANKEIRCAFIARQIAVKSAYQLWVTEAEFNMMQTVLEKCPSQEAGNSQTLRP